MLDTLQKSDFEPHVGTKFRIALTGSEPLELELAEARSLGGQTIEGSRRLPFAVTFKGGPRDRYLPQRIYDLEHPTLGTLSIFLVPLGPDEEAMRYEAVFT
jgi:Domain of unknown function (DUF6916)